MRVSCLLFAAVLTTTAAVAQPGDPASFRSELLFPLQHEHVHGSSVTELADGSLLAAWFQGSGERWADDVAIMGARLQPGSREWSAPFVLADTPGFPDINPVVFVDQDDRLWLLWYAVVANLWETSLLKYRIDSSGGTGSGAPEWSWQEVLHVKPGDPAERGVQPDDRFVGSVERQLSSYREHLERTGVLADTSARALWREHAERLRMLAAGDDLVQDGRLYHADGTVERRPMGYPYFRRMGWQSRAKPVLLGEDRIVVPLYSDGFSFSLMAITDDGGRTWSFSNPLVAAGNIQPAIAQRDDGTLVAYMRDNGPPPQRLHVSTSSDRGDTWTDVRDSDLLNPGSAADVVVLESGSWLLVYNDTEDGRHSLAAALSDDEGRTWPWKRHIELDTRADEATRSHYPAVIQARDGTIHVTYSYHHQDREGAPSKTIKHAAFDEAWVRAGD